jgi:hypothetical protein
VGVTLSYGTKRGGLRFALTYVDKKKPAFNSLKVIFARRMCRTSRSRTMMDVRILTFLRFVKIENALHCTDAVISFSGRIP